MNLSYSLEEIYFFIHSFIIHVVNNKWLLTICNLFSKLSTTHIFCIKRSYLELKHVFDSFLEKKKLYLFCDFIFHTLGLLTITSF